MYVEVCQKLFLTSYRQSTRASVSRLQ